MIRMHGFMFEWSLQSLKKRVWKDFKFQKFEKEFEKNKRKPNPLLSLFSLPAQINPWPQVNPIHNGQLGQFC
jgi:hypothetical protein